MSKSNVVRPPSDVRWLMEKDKMNFESECVRCGITYHEIEHIGKWECSFHVGLPVEKKAKTHGAPFYQEVWSCCPDELFSAKHKRGCIRCDHSSDTKVIRRGKSYDAEVSWLKYIMPLREAVSETRNKGRVNIYRSAEPS